MNAKDVLRYGQLTLLGTLEQVPATILEDPGACGIWSIRDIVAHLASYEIVLVEILGSAVEPGPTPMLDRFRQQGDDFNDLEVAARTTRTMPDLLSELSDAHERSLQLVSKIAPETLRQPGTLPWYGDEYALDDLIVYMYYGHKREHSAQVEAFRDRLSRESMAGGKAVAKAS